MLGGVDIPVLEAVPSVMACVANIWRFCRLVAGNLPLFIDPFLLFNSEDPEYQQIHREMIDYLHFLQEQSQLRPTLSKGMRLVISA